MCVVATRSCTGLHWLTPAAPAPGKDAPPAPAPRKRGRGFDEGAEGDLLRMRGGIPASDAFYILPHCLFNPSLPRVVGPV